MMINLKSIVAGAALSLVMLGTSSCNDSFIYHDGGDCTPKVQFVFKKHRQALQSVEGREPDAFYSTVGTVHLFVYNEAGELVFERTEDTQNLKSAVELGIGPSDEHCYMPVDLNPGMYKLVAWCGLDNTDKNNAFELKGGAPGKGYSHCEVKHSASTGNPVNDAKYESVYHGIVQSVEVVIDADNAQVIPIELTKDNNDIAVWVQHTNRILEDGEYEVVYVDNNGTMHFETNDMTTTDRHEYHAHTSSNLTTSTEYNGSVVETGALVAHISTSRLMESNMNDARLEVRTKEGDAVFSIPFIKYVLQMQTFTNNGQYYLDCEDTYNCSFYLTGNDETFMPARIIINNWVVVPQQSDDL